jgi:hypothetical protein
LGTPEDNPNNSEHNNPKLRLKRAIRRRVGLKSKFRLRQMRKISLVSRITHPNRAHGVGNHFGHNQVKHLLLNLSKRAGNSVQDEPTLLINIEANPTIKVKEVTV